MVHNDVKTNKGLLNRLKTKPAEKIPVVYHARYNSAFHTGFAGLDKAPGLESAPYARLNHLLVSGGLYRSEQLSQPERITSAELALGHDRPYLENLKQPQELARIFNMAGLAKMPAFLAYKMAVSPHFYQAGGTVLAARLARRHGWALNLAGGYSLASATRPGPAAPLADMALAIKAICRDDPQIRKIMIIDTNLEATAGLYEDFDGDPDIYVVDLHGRPAKAGVPNVAGIYENIIPTAGSGSGAQHFLKSLSGAFNRAAPAFAPDMIFYSAGTDICLPSSAGGCDADAATLAARDEMVFDFAFKKAVPLVMCLGGGYRKEHASYQAHSIKNLNQRFGLI